MGKPNLRVVSLFLSLLILALLIAYADPPKFLALLSQSNYTFIIIAFLFSTLSVIFRIMKWKALLGDISFSRIAPVQLVGVTISNFSPAKAAEPVKALILKVK